jgi:hypothetical protein
LRRTDPNGHGEVQPLDPAQVRSVQSDIKAVQKFADEHPVITSILINVGVVLVDVLSRGEAPLSPGDFHAPGDVPNGQVIVRGGQGAIPSGTFSASQGATLEEAGAGVRNGTIQPSTARAIREAGGEVRPAPEPAYPNGPVNGQHVNVTGGQNTFGPPETNPVPPTQRVPAAPKPPKPPKPPNPSGTGGSN